ncbi:secreted Ly-6/uPAR domain-containing protein 2-like [Dromiciops gliroides]|uniref:secreted Ly-6/uPAR domain-containing protein 2-like n=1 Tax=Dromiciops gliroides TaxID=33562 RepID=UPI001CC525C3|nr:secreted Ly-6/uPAR domain-containing protein 2-like [Dromiciops gliroides]XP_043847288.1 secreted Ly-6/uPAR domain-containing protein 2-like [Dromiciops gliroides]
MKAGACQFLLPLLLLGQVSMVLALKCHECVGIGDCLKPTECNNQTRYCLNTWDTPPGEKTWVTKSCAYSCPPALEEYGSSPATCCRTDLCNSALTIGLSGVLLITCLWTGVSRALFSPGL